MKTFLEYLDIDLYSSTWETVEVDTRDVSKIDWKKTFPYFPPTFLGFPSHFRFFDAESPQGRRSNVSKDYVIAEAVMPLEDYRAREEAKFEGYRKNKTSAWSRFCDALVNGGDSLKNAFRAALEPARPVMHRYMAEVEQAIAAAEKSGATHVHLWSATDCSVAKPVTPDMIVLDRGLAQLWPPVAPPPPQAKPGL